MSKFKVGDIIVGNDKSDGKYGITCKKYGFVGVVIKVDSYGKIGTRITEHSNIRYVDCACWVDGDYFELKGTTNPQIHNNLKQLKVIQNEDATIVFFNDGTKEVVKKCDNEKYDIEKALAMACAKKLLGGYTGFKEAFSEQLGDVSEYVYVETDLENAIEYLKFTDGTGFNCKGVVCYKDDCPLLYEEYKTCEEAIKGREIEAANFFRKIRKEKGELNYE